ncbi:aspartate racemase [Chimaeribacter arupi]|uniref:Aspartate racemase n=1 Tax=Chimaeribacter arupi TaxID=2060066 RepID=A0A2N5EQ66_9GAMM|nr:aspartate/glutamate racemase family protein [Chimaeribacter arupi]MDV5140402.1 aspartate/glutamate racemase family protein [Chimaeribacter arupi]PLR50036.1 aspartate racemase [Chimaeribacter arupi]PLR51546.1 aspartate racemase [Chimaeribacter arupi]
MKTLGLIGGMSWESTVPYYRMINEQVKQQLGGLHSAQLVLYSVDFDRIEQLQRQGAWQEAGQLLGEAAAALRRAGAEVVVLCTNTMHKVADDIERIGGLPLLHIADATAQAVQQQGIRRVALLGTRFTMEQDFYTGRLTQQAGLEVIVPDEADRDTVHRIIYDELCLGILRDESRDAYRRIMQRLESRGAGGIILGCTEIALLVGAQDAQVPVFDTTALHAAAAARFALA